MSIAARTALYLTLGTASVASASEGAAAPQSSQAHTSDASPPPARPPASCRDLTAAQAVANTATRLRCTTQVLRQRKAGRVLSFVGAAVAVSGLVMIGGAANPHAGHLAGIMYIPGGVFTALGTSLLVPGALMWSGADRRLRSFREFGAAPTASVSFRF